MWRSLIRPETVEWSRVRHTGFFFLAVEVEVESGRHPRMKVTGLAESGEHVDHFEISQGLTGRVRAGAACVVRGAGGTRGARPARPHQHGHIPTGATT